MPDNSNDFCTGADYPGPGLWCDYDNVSWTGDSCVMCVMCHAAAAVKVTTISWQMFSPAAHLCSRSAAHNCWYLDSLESLESRRVMSCCLCARPLCRGGGSSDTALRCLSMVTLHTWYCPHHPTRQCDRCDIVSVIFPDSGHSDTTFIQLYNTTTILYNTTMLQNTLNRYLMLMLVSERFWTGS